MPDPILTDEEIGTLMQRYFGALGIDEPRVEEHDRLYELILDVHAIVEERVLERCEAKYAAAHAAADGYAGDLAAVVRCMNTHDYPHHPEYGNDDEIIRRLVEMASQYHKAREDSRRLDKLERLMITPDVGFSFAKELLSGAVLRTAIDQLEEPEA